MSTSGVQEWSRSKESKQGTCYKTVSKRRRKMRPIGKIRRAQFFWVEKRTSNGRCKRGPYFAFQAMR